MAELSTLTTELVGRRYPEFKFHITESWVRDYKEALGYSFDKTSNPELIPNTFVGCLRDAEFCVFSALNIDLSQLLHAGQTFRFLKPLCVGDLISSQSEIIKVSHKKGSRGEMVFMDITNVFKRIAHKGVAESAPVPLVESTMNLVVRPPA